MRILFFVLALLAFPFASKCQDHGTVTFQNKTIKFTGYRTRMSQEKRWIIAEGIFEGKLYTVTVTAKPDIGSSGDIKTDADHSVTLTVSNTDYTNAQNFCFNAGSKMQAVMQNSKLSISGTDMLPDNCFGKPKNSDKLSFVIKP